LATVLPILSCPLSSIFPTHVNILPPSDPMSCHPQYNILASATQYSAVLNTICCHSLTNILPSSIQYSVVLYTIFCLPLQYILPSSIKYSALLYTIFCHPLYNIVPSSLQRTAVLYIVDAVLYPIFAIMGSIPASFSPIPDG
jgi:hypothetical protein